MMFVCLFLHEFSDFYGGDNEGQRLSEKRDASVFRVGSTLKQVFFLFEPSFSCYIGLKYFKL
jgi:hypothetical protein